MIDWLTKKKNNTPESKEETVTEETYEALLINVCWSLLSAGERAAVNISNPLVYVVIMDTNPLV